MSVQAIKATMRLRTMESSHGKGSLRSDPIATLYVVAGRQNARVVAIK
jgi:hypothetical protein